MSELYSKFPVPASNAVGEGVVTRTVLQCDMVKVCKSQIIHGDIILQYCAESKFCFLYAYVQCMSEMLSSFKSLHQILREYAPEEPSTLLVDVEELRRQGNMVKICMPFKGTIL